MKALTEFASAFQLGLLVLEAAMMPSSIQNEQIVKRLNKSVTNLIKTVMAKGTSFSPKVFPFGLKYFT